MATYWQKQGGEHIGQGRTENVQIETDTWAETICNKKQMSNQPEHISLSIVSLTVPVNYVQEIRRVFSPVSNRPQRRHIEEEGPIGLHRADDHQNKDNCMVSSSISESSKLGGA